MPIITTPPYEPRSPVTTFWPLPAGLDSSSDSDLSRPKSSPIACWLSSGVSTESSRAVGE